MDPYHNKEEQEEPPEAMDLPDDLNLDENEAGGDDKEEGQGQLSSIFRTVYIKIFSINIMRNKNT